jgi:hypothetical protein
MARTVGISPGYLRKLDDSQQKFILTAVGRAFYDEFLCAHGKHLFVFGTTGSGKTNKGYAFLDWLKHLEKQIWISSGKIGETLPLLCMGKRIEVIVPDGCDVIFEEKTDGKWQRIENHPRVIPVSTPKDMLMSIGAGSYTDGHNLDRNLITILEVRNAFSRNVLAVQWNAEFFTELALATREGTISRILPASLHVDESQWTMAGQRVSGDPDRTKASEIIAENAFELRSAGMRLVLYAQSWKNILPTARENMLFSLICRGGDVKHEENAKLAEWCRLARHRRPPSPRHFETKHGRFVFESDHKGWGDSYPPENPWEFRLYPLSEDDRAWIKRCRVRYVGKHDQKAGTYEVSEECMPDLGRFSAQALPPSQIDEIFSRWESERVVENGVREG